jgi:uncharacterized SAM-binding protein YcdF (DUF218 family)
MFAFSKIFWMLVNPVTLFLALFLLGTALLFTRFRRFGRTLVATAATLMLLIGIFPVGGWLTERLENRFPANPAIPSEITGIIVLGGTINQYLTVSRKQPSLSAGGERLTEFVYLARRFPEAQLMFSGGSGSLIDQTLKEADAARMFFNRMGLPDDRVKYEAQARNTLENSLYSKELAGDDASGTWVLVTSAFHMPRAMGVFRQAGWRIIPYPVDYYTDGRESFSLGFQPFRGMADLIRASHEWIGLLAYRILGRTGTFFPAPGDPSDN